MIDTAGRAFRNPDSDETYNGYKMQSMKQALALMPLGFHSLGDKYLHTLLFSRVVQYARCHANDVGRPY